MHEHTKNVRTFFFSCFISLLTSVCGINQGRDTYAEFCPVAILQYITFAITDFKAQSSGFSCLDGKDKRIKSSVCWAKAKD